MEKTEWAGGPFKKSERLGPQFLREGEKDQNQGGPALDLLTASRDVPR
jgi:hypothetical protein